MKDITQEIKSEDKVLKKEFRGTKLYFTKAGDRTLTPAQKRKKKEKEGLKCKKCSKKFSFEDAQDYLQIHHKKSISSYKDKLTGVDIPIITLGKKYIPKYDRRRSNLEVLCLKCHKKITKREYKRKATQNKKQKAWWNNL